MIFYDTLIRYYTILYDFIWYSRVLRDTTRYYTILYDTITKNKKKSRNVRPGGSQEASGDPQNTKRPSKIAKYTPRDAPRGQIGETRATKGPNGTPRDPKDTPFREYG
jgi:hypothetical protein